MPTKYVNNPFLEINLNLNNLFKCIAKFPKTFAIIYMKYLYKNKTQQMKNVSLEIKGIAMGCDFREKPDNFIMISQSFMMIYKSHRLIKSSQGVFLGRSLTLQKLKGI